MNRKLIIGGLVVTALSLWGFLACSAQQPNEGCALESGSSYWAKYTLTSQSGNCNFFATYDPNGNLLVDGNGNWLSGESIAVQEYGPDQGPITVQFTPQSLALDLPDGGFAIGTLGAIQLTNNEPTVCDIATVSPSGQIVGDPNFGVHAPPGGSNPKHHPNDEDGATDGGTSSTGANTSSTGSTGGTSTGANTSSTGSTGTQTAGSTGGGSTGNSVTSTAGSTAGSTGVAGSTGTVAAGSTGGGTTGSGTTGGSASASAASASAASASAASTSGGGGPPPVVVTYSFSNVAFQEAYSILGKQFSATLNYTQVPLEAGAGTSCTATIDVEAVQYNDYAAGQPGHIEGNHCEQDTNGDQTDCSAHASTFGFPVTTGWTCQPFGNQNFLNLLIENGALAPEQYADGGFFLADGGLIPVQRCVPATTVPVGALND